MIQPQSNPLRRELARGKGKAPHPDDDVLTAFAENALAGQERGRVLEHLSTCAACREVLSHATSAMPEAVVREELHVLPVRRPLRSWLPWVATAAAVVAVCSAVVMHQKGQELREQASGPVTMAKLTPPAPPQLQPLQPTPAPPEQDRKKRQEAAPAAVIGQPKKAAAAAAAQNQASQVAISPPQQETLKKTPFSAAKSLRSMESRYGNLPPDTGRLEQQNGLSRPPAALPAPPAPPAQTAAMAQVRAGTGAAAMDSVEIENAAALATPLDAAGGGASSAAKAKTATAAGGAAAAPALASGAAGSMAGFSSTIARAHWRISDGGQAQRSVGNGAWQPVLPDEKAKMRVLSVYGGEVWIGGDDLRLYRSQDDGATWQLIQLPKKDSGAHAVTHIRFQSGQAGTVEADNGTQWTTVDGGQTWK